MKKTLLTALFVGLSWYGIGLTGEPVSKPLEEVVKEQPVRFLKKVVPESYDVKQGEVILWLYTTGEKDCKIKLERKENFTKKQRDGKQVLFFQNNLSVRGSVATRTKTGYAIDGTTPVKVSETSETSKLPEELDTKEISIDVKFKKAPLENALGLKPSYRVGEVNPLYYEKGSISAVVPGKGMGGKILNMKKQKIADRIPDFLTVTHSEKEGKLTEIVRHYDILSEDKFELRAETRRPVSESEVKDYRAYRTYSLVPIEKSGIKFEGQKITSASYLRNKKLLKVVFGKEYGYAPLRRLAKNPIVGKLPHFIFRGEQGTYYARIQDGKIMIYTSEKGPAKFSKELQARCLKVDLDNAEKVPEERVEPKKRDNPFLPRII